MQQANTFDSRFDKRTAADDRMVQVAGLWRQVVDAWDRLRRSLIDVADAVSIDEAQDSEATDDGPGIFENYYEGAHRRVSAAEPVTSFRKLERR